MLLNFEHINKNGIDYVLVPEKNFKEIQEQLEDAEDLRQLRADRAANSGNPKYTHEEVLKELGMKD